MRLRVSRILCFLVLTAGCLDVEAPLPTCTEGRSRCVVQVALGHRFACAALLDRTVWCWGRNDESQLGYPTTDLCPEELPGGQTRSVACHTFPFQVVGLDHVVRVSAGGAFACAQRDDGTVRCWGSNAAGQLGNGLTLPSQTPVVVRGLTGVTALAAGARHACAVSKGKVWCWGANDRGQLGVAAGTRQCMTAEGNPPCDPEATEIAGLESVTAVTAGESHTCARTAEGLALCWGDGRYGQIGVASAEPGPMPQAVLAGDLPLEAIQDLTSGPMATCARTEEGAVWCWGRNDHGELGRASETMMPEHCAGPCDPRPAVVGGLERRNVSPDAGPDASSDDAADGSSDDADVRRDARADVTADASSDTSSDAPTDATADEDVADDVPDVARVRDALAPPSMVPRGIAAGGTFACALLDDNTARCWGDDSDGQLGDGRRVRDPQGPVIVIATPGAARTNPLQRVSSLAAGTATACALLDDRSVRCWGSNTSGALGNGTTSAQSGPVPVTW